jgi:hypothetical protein
MIVPWGVMVLEVSSWGAIVWSVASVYKPHFRTLMQDGIPMYPIRRFIAKCYNYTGAELEKIIVPWECGSLEVASCVLSSGVVVGLSICIQNAYQGISTNTN